MFIELKDSYTLPERWKWYISCSL